MKTYINYSLRLEVEDYQALKAKAERYHLSMSELLKRAFKSYEQEVDFITKTKQSV